MRARVIALGVALLAASPLSAQYFGKNKVRYDSFAWKVYATPHFRISYYDRVEPNLQKVASFAESAYDDLARRLNFQIVEPIPLIAYATHADFEQTNVIVEFIPEGVGAFAVPARNRMVLPIDLPDIELQRLIQHELTHIFQYEILFQGRLGKAVASRPPQWFMEGMASYFAKDEDSRAKAVMRDAVLSDRVPSVADPVSGYFAYRFGHRVFDFVEAEWGQEGVRDLVYEFRNTLGNQVDRAIRRAFNLEIEEFDADFRAWLRKEYIPLAAERGNPTEFGPAFRSEQRSGAYEASPVASPSGDLIAAFSTYKEDVDVVLLGVPDRRLFRNLTRGLTTDYEYLVAQLLTLGPDRGRDLAFSPDGNHVAVFARHEGGRRLLLLDVRKGGIARHFDIPVGQAMQPAWSPDGATIAFKAIDGGKGDIFLLDLASGQVRNLTDDAAYDTAPCFTPDGTAIVFSSQTAEFAKIYRISLADPGVREQLTFGPGDDEGAALSRDGKVVYFASDRDSEIFDLYSLDLETRTLSRLTRIIGAALNPTPISTRDGERVVYQGYHKGRWWLYVTDPAEAEAIGPQEVPEHPPERTPFVPAVSVAIAEENIKEVEKFKLFVEDVQVLAGINEDQTFLAQTYLSFSDQYGDKRVTALIESVSGYSNFQFSYVDLGKRLQWGATVFDDRSYFVSYDQFEGDLRRSDRLYRETGVAAFAQYPTSRYHRLEGSVGYLNRDVDYPAVFPDGSVGYISFKDEIPFVQLGFNGDTTFWREYGPHAGRRYRLSLDYGHDASNGGALTYGFRIDARQYVPISARNELAFRLWAAAADGNRPNIYYFGGLDTLRGYDYRSLAGNRAGYANLEWRFPLVDHLVLPWLYLRDLRGRVFLDVGAAWFDVPGFEQPFECVADGRLKDCVSSYGFGFSVNIFGLPMHWDYTKRWDFEESLTEGFNSSFWIGFRF